MLPNQPAPFEWFFACPPFVEPLLAEELGQLGAIRTKIGHSGVQAQGDLRFGYQAILWSRLASRATLQLAQGFGKDHGELGALVQSVAWPEHLRADGAFKVRFSGQNEDINNTQFGAQWVKDQIVDQFRSQQGVRPSISNHAPDVVVSVNVYGGKASIGIELNHKGLHQRGYRDPDAPYAMNENLAAAVLVRAGWPTLLASDAAHLALVDPLCDGGSFLAEGALMAFDIAPGLLRGATLAERWLGHDAGLWAGLLAEARQRQRDGLARAGRFTFWGNDLEAGSVATAQADWQALGLPAAHWRQQAIKALAPPVLPDACAGLVVVRMPLAETQQDAFSTVNLAVAMRPLYAALGQWLAGLPGGLWGALFADSAAPLELTDLFYSKTYRFMNGKQDSKLWTLDKLAQKTKPTVWVSEDFANRITKNLRKLKTFIKRGHTDAYRIYDADIPEFALAVDRYGDWLHVQEYAPPASIEEAVARQRLEQALLTLPEVLGIPPERIVLKQRRRQKGLNQYEKQGQGGQVLTVVEHGVRFKVNLTEYLDTGIFLDHRPIRLWVQQQAKGKAVLNLFCYTGTASVHAAVGGAKRVDSVDMSATYLAWAEENFRLNGLRPNPYQYRFIRDNAVEWLAHCQGRYDLIFLDPPTFSNSKRMGDIFDVQRDHPALIRDAMRLLGQEGVLVFSNNFRKFRMDAALEAEFAVEDYRMPSIPEDFQRDPKIHGCWLIRKR